MTYHREQVLLTCVTLGVSLAFCLAVWAVILTALVQWWAE